MKQIKRVWFSDDRIFIETAVGLIQSQPMRYFPRLSRATDGERAQWSESPFGLHWEAVDEDISFESFAWGDNDSRSLYSQAN